MLFKEKQQLQDILDYLEYLELKNQMLEHDITQPLPLGQHNTRARFLSQVVANQITDFADQVGITTDQYAENLTISLKAKFQIGDIHRPQNGSLQPEEMAEKYLNYDSPITKSQLQILETVTKHLAVELFMHPVIKQQVWRMYSSLVRISTQPVNTNLKKNKSGQPS